MSRSYDFSGWATRANVKCGDGRTIMKDAFADNDGETVPLVWNHQHNDHFNVLGHALLENRPEGVYAYCTFNDTDSGKNAKLLVENGDIKSLSIYANRLKHKGSNVIHGMIREVSLVLAGANPQAYIDTVIEHGEALQDEAIMYFDEDISVEEGLEHSEEEEVSEEETMEHAEADPKEKTVKDVIDSMSQEQQNVLYGLIGALLSEESDSEEEKSVAHSDEKKGDDAMAAEKTVKDVYDEMTEEQKAVVDLLVGEAVAQVTGEGGEEGNMKHNLFDQDEEMQEDYISHSDMTAVISDAKRYGSMRESALEHGITNIDYLFPDAQTLQDRPDFITRDMGWVTKVMNGVHHSPFSRVKSIFANLTADEARARGYVKGNLKVDEVIALLKRQTLPCTIYKKQSLDRDDVIDITDFDVVSWLKTEMRMMLDEEIARAILISDGRGSSSDDKINEQNIRPIWTDEDLYTIKKDIDATATTPDQKAKSFIRTAVKARKDYKGSGEPTLFTYEDVLTDMLLLEDSTGRIIYDNVSKLATALRVKDIVVVPVMEDPDNEHLRQDTAGDKHKLLGIIVNLNDYNVGADKGGAVNMFDDFDIDYNKEKYLIETRCSGAMVKPYGAIAIEMVVEDE